MPSARPENPWENDPEEQESGEVAAIPDRPSNNDIFGQEWEEFKTGQDWPFLNGKKIKKDDCAPEGIREENERSYSIVAARTPRRTPKPDPIEAQAETNHGPETRRMPRQYDPLNPLTEVHYVEVDNDIEPVQDSTEEPQLEEIGPAEPELEVTGPPEVIARVQHKKTVELGIIQPLPILDPNPSRERRRPTPSTDRLEIPEAIAKHISERAKSLDPKPQFSVPQALPIPTPLSIGIIDWIKQMGNIRAINQAEISDQDWLALRIALSIKTPINPHSKHFILAGISDSNNPGTFLLALDVAQNNKWKYKLSPALNHTSTQSEDPTTSSEDQTPPSSGNRTTSEQQKIYINPSQTYRELINRLFHLTHSSQI